MRMYLNSVEVEKMEILNPQKMKIEKAEIEEVERMVLDEIRERRRRGI